MSTANLNMDKSLANIKRLESRISTTNFKNFVSYQPLPARRSSTIRLYKPNLHQDDEDPFIDWLYFFLTTDKI